MDTLGLLRAIAGSEAAAFPVAAGAALAPFSLLQYAAAGWVVTASFVHSYEEPTLLRQFRAEYEAYRRAYLPGGPACAPGLSASAR